MVSTDDIGIRYFLEVTESWRLTYTRGHQTINQRAVMVSPGRWHYNGEGDCAAVTCFIIGFDHRPGGLEALDVQIMITSSSCMMDGMAKSSHRISWRFASCEFPLAYASVHDNVSNNPTFGIHTCAHKNFSLSLSLLRFHRPNRAARLLFRLSYFVLSLLFSHYK